LVFAQEQRHNMKFVVAIALCCAAQISGLGLPNYLMPQTTFQTIPPWQFSVPASPTSTPVSLQNGDFIASVTADSGFLFVVPPTYKTTNRQYRRVYDQRNEYQYVPINNYVLLSNADWSAVAPRAKVLAMGPNVTQISQKQLGKTVAHPALFSDAFGSGPSSDSATAMLDNFVVNQGECLAWTGTSLDWNMLVFSSYDQIVDSHWLLGLDSADQTWGGFNSEILVGSSSDMTVDVANPLSTTNRNDPNFYPQTWIRTSPQGDGLYFCQDTALLGEVSIQNGEPSVYYRPDPKTHIAYGGFRPNQLFNSGCDRQSFPGGAPAYFGACSTGL